ncbi:MarR family transcriptional regulator [Salinicola endophyticus]|uniref:MarR family transcriptional regulator n=1 Tax=Salinicola endophyticus TaxID=1949083 RepID=A0AB74UB02_9GAMM
MDQVDHILRQWHAERPDLDVVPMGLLGRLKRLTQHISRRTEAVLAEHGLTPADFDVLATLRRAGSPYTLTPSTLIAWTMVTSGTMTHRIDRLVKPGYVERIRNPEDGRGFQIRLTPQGLELIDEAVDSHVDNQHAMTRCLSDDERAELDRLLGKWLACFES